LGTWGVRGEQYGQSYSFVCRQEKKTNVYVCWQLLLSRTCMPSIVLITRKGLQQLSVVFNFLATVQDSSQLFDFTLLNVWPVLTKTYTASAIMSYFFTAGVHFYHRPLYMTCVWLLVTGNPLTPSVSPTHRHTAILP
jgi:hypothetical protein